MHSDAVNRARERNVLQQEILKMNHKTGWVIFSALLLLGGLGCMGGAMDADGGWAIAGSILIFTFVYLQMKLRE